MKNSKAVFQELVDKITLSEDADEIKSIAFVIMESIFRLTRTDILAGKMISVHSGDQSALENYISRINASEPVQYIVGETCFYGRSFFVDTAVLIPRPETEMLVRTVLSWIDSRGISADPVIRILDIGTGSGCLPVTLKLELPAAEVYATDISAASLDVARKNASRHGADVTFLKHDILNEAIPVSNVDVLVSNPPYVTRSESKDMKDNVLRYEPHTALFVPDNDPLLFYNAILRSARRVLAPAGLLIVEINEKFGDDVAALFIRSGLRHVSILEDTSGKPRVVQAVK